MKKRKELNALIGLGDSKRKKPKKSSGHRLLRTEPHDSESESSSEDDDFSGLSGGAGFGKRSYTQCCALCYPLFLFIILAACVMACAGLIWMQIALKDDLDALKEKLHSMETSQKASSSEIPKISEELKNSERQLDEVEHGDRGLNKLWSNLSDINRKLLLLDSAVTHLKSNLKSSADLISLPSTVEELQKSVATIGSTLTSVQHDVKSLQEALDTRQEAGQHSMETTDVSALRDALSDVNRTEEQHHTWTHTQVHALLSTVADLHHRVASMENSGRVMAAHPSGDLQSTPTAATAAAQEEPPETVTAAHRTPKVRLPRSPNAHRGKRAAAAGCPKRLRLKGITSLRDLERLFQRSAVGLDSPGLRLEDLAEEFGWSSMVCVDQDQDQRVSLRELSDAVALRRN